MITSNRTTWDETWLALAHGIAKRSLCSRDQVGAVIVSADNTPLMASYNGPPSGYPHNDQPCIEWCPRAMPMFHPSGVTQLPTRNSAFTGSLSPTYEDCPALHAEANGLSRSSHIHRKGGTIYVTSDVCFNCAKLIANSGLKRVVVDKSMPRAYRNADKSYKFLESCGLVVALTVQDPIGIPADYAETAE